MFECPSWGKVQSLAVAPAKFIALVIHYSLAQPAAKLWPNKDLPKLGKSET